MSFIATQSTFNKFLNSPAGPKTIHFWAPMFKWGIVLAGLGDLKKPADQLSISQNISLCVTGLIWTRYGFVVTPVNRLISVVNFSVFSIGATQIYRILNHRQTIKESIPMPEKVLL